ncbi:12578_t:CDS:2, partial [Acaulospora morrowiae]
DDDYDPADNESISHATERSESITTDSIANETDFDVEIQPFLFDKAEFEKARTLVETYENDDIHFLNDINTEVDNDNTLTSSIFELESESSDGSDYLVENILNTNQKLSACPILDLIDGRIQCCSSNSSKQRPLTQLIGTWELDTEAFQQAEKENRLSMIGVCPVFNESESISNTKTEYRPRYICSTCFIAHGGHFFERSGRGNKSNFECINRHKNDVNEALKVLGQWIIHMTESNNENKVDLLKSLTSILPIFCDIKSTSIMIDPPSLLFVKIALRLGHFQVTKISEQQYNITADTAIKLGQALGVATWRSRHDVRIKKEQLANPTSFAEYQSGFPSSRLNAILRQDIYKIDIRNTKGRRARNIVVHKLQIPLLEHRNKTKEGQKREYIDQSKNTNINSEQKNGSKRQRRLTTDNEKRIIEQILVYDTFPEDMVIEVLRQLQDYSNDWNEQRIRIYWNNHH